MLVGPVTTAGWARPAANDLSAPTASGVERATTPRRPRPALRRRARVCATSLSGTFAPSLSSQSARRSAAAGSTAGDPAGTRSTSDAAGGVCRRRDRAVRLSCGGCSRMTWALVPENPKEETAASLVGACTGHGVSSVGTKKRVLSAAMAGFQRVKLTLGG